MRTVVWFLLLLAPAPAFAQEDADLDVGTPSQDLYLKRRPATGASVRVPKDLEPILQKKEAQAQVHRREAIRLLEGLIRSKPEAATESEALFKLAELLWEEARIEFVAASRRYQD